MVKRAWKPRVGDVVRVKLSNNCVYSGTRADWGGAIGNSNSTFHFGCHSKDADGSNPTIVRTNYEDVNGHCFETSLYPSTLTGCGHYTLYELELISRPKKEKK